MGEELKHDSKGSLKEFRRLKRIRLAKKKKNLVFTITPTPKNYQSESTPNIKIYRNMEVTNKENKYSDNLVAQVLDSAKIKRFIRVETEKSKFFSDSILCEADYQEFEMFRRFILEKKTYSF